MLITKFNNQKHFIFFCSKDRQPVYRNIFSSLPQVVILIDDWNTLICHCIKESPLGVIVEMSTGIRLGVANMNYIYNLNVKWPVMRCNIDQAGSARVMCFHPYKIESLSNALDAIAKGDNSWSNPKSRRNHVRLEVLHRVRIHSELNKKEWIPGNLMNISKTGSFILTYVSAEIGENIKLEILDVYDTPTICKAKIIWRHLWSDGNSLPGIGLVFEPESFSPLFNQLLEKLNGQKKLLQKLKK